jgi:hypothetical protein
MIFVGHHMTVKILFALALPLNANQMWDNVWKTKYNLV